MTVKRELEGFALADGYDDQSMRYVGLAIPHEDSCGQVTDATLLVHPRLAQEQRDKERSRVEPPPGPGPGPGPIIEPPLPPRPIIANTRFFGVCKLNPERNSRDLTRLSQEILQHLASVPDDELEVSVEISARRGAGFPDDKVRVVNENARVLKFDQLGFEND